MQELESCTKRASDARVDQVIASNTELGFVPDCTRRRKDGFRSDLLLIQHVSVSMNDCSIVELRPRNKLTNVPVTVVRVFRVAGQAPYSVEGVQEVPQRGS